MLRSSLLWLGASLALLAGCGRDDGSGALGQASARTSCAPDDASCSSFGLRGPLAAGVSLPVEISLSLQGGGAPPLVLSSADPSVLVVEGSRLRGVTPGVAALLITTPDQRVVDFVHVFVEQATELVVVRRTHDGAELAPVTGSMQLVVGDDINLSAEPYAGDRRLAGEVVALWETPDPDVLQLLDAARPAQRRLRARAPGSTSVTVRTDSTTQTIQVEVLP